MFDVTMGCWDGAEVCELTGAYILGKLISFFNISNIARPLGNPVCYGSCSLSYFPPSLRP